MNGTFLLAINKAVKKPVVEGDKIVVGDVMQCNFVVDHRYVDGANCSKLIGIFHDVFENPEKYLKSSKPLIKEE